MADVEDAILKAKIVRTYLETYKKTKKPALLDALFTYKNSRPAGLVQELKDYIDELIAEVNDVFKKAGKND